jgi:hypothetical protein
MAARGLVRLGLGIGLPDHPGAFSAARVLCRYRRSGVLDYNEDGHWNEVTEDNNNDGRFDRFRRL